MINLVIPMAGSGSRFSDAGYKDPKPMIKIGKYRMIEWVIMNLAPPVDIDLRYIFIARKEHLKNHQFLEILNFDPNNIILPIDHLTDGAASTVSLASDYINNDQHLIIANSDQFVNINIEEFYRTCLNGSDGTIMTFRARSNKWSYVALDKNDNVMLVREKEPISNIATVGIYHFRNGSSFISGVKQMKAKELTVNGEYYVAPVYNELIENESKIDHFPIERKQMHGLGTPEDLDAFMQSTTFHHFNNLNL